MSKLNCYDRSIKKPVRFVLSLTKFKDIISGDCIYITRQ